MAENGHLEFERSGHIGTLWLNRPPVNALGSDLIRQLRAFAEETRAEVESGSSIIRALVLAARGKHFCAGADLKERAGLAESEVEAAVNVTRDMVTAMASLPVPLIAAVQGIAVGGGMELTLAADFRVLGSSARMGLRETALAIIPGAGGTQRLPRLIGVSAALYWITTGKLFPAEACLQHGVATAVVPDEKLLEESLALAEEIAANGPLAVRAARSAVVEGAALDLTEGLELEKQCYRSIIPTSDRVEALKAFQEKRKPVFEGK